MDRIRVSEALDTGSIPVGRTSHLRKRLHPTRRSMLAANPVRLAFLMLDESGQHTHQNSLDHLLRALVVP